MQRTLRTAIANARFAAAVIVAGAHDTLEKWRGLRAALKTQGTIHPDLKASRMIVCQQCPLYFHRFGLRTCGSPLPGGYRDEDGKPDGCFCDIEKKAGSAVNCFMYDKHRGQTIIGWPMPLNSFPHDEQSEP